MRSHTNTCTAKCECDVSSALFAITTEIVFLFFAVVIRCETLRVFNFYTVDSHHCFSVFFAVPRIAHAVVASFSLVRLFLILPFYRRPLVRLSHYFQPIFFWRFFCALAVWSDVVLIFLFALLLTWTWTYIVTVKTKLFLTVFPPRKIPFVWW